MNSGKEDSYKDVSSPLIFISLSIISIEKGFTPYEKRKVHDIGIQIKSLKRDYNQFIKHLISGKKILGFRF